MTRLTSPPACAEIVDEMLAVARCPKQQRIIVAGAKSTEIMRDLHRRGYHRVITTAHCGLPASQYDTALIDWRERSTKALASTFDWLVGFLTPAGVVVVWVDRQDTVGKRMLRIALENHGFAIEVGINQAYGSAVSARRCKTCAIFRVA